MSGYTTTPNYGLFKPTINADNDQWGNHLNANADTLDTTLKTIQNSAGVTTWNTRAGAVVLTASDVTTVLPPSSTPPVMDSTATIGVGTTWARSDHVHPSDTTRQTAAQVATAVAPAFNGVGRNLLHNPLFNVAQRGAGPWTTSVYTADRWFLGVSLDTVSINVIAAADADRTQIGDEAATRYLQNNFTGNAGAAAVSYIHQPMEGVRRFAGKTVTVSFWAAASSALKLGANIYQNFGSGGSPSAGVWALATGNAITLSTTWTRYTTTIAIPSATGKTLGTNGDDGTWLRFFYSAGSSSAAMAGNIGVQSGTISIWGVQLEIGSVATPLEKPDPRYDLSNCQRFYQSVICSVRATGAAIISLTSPATWPPMRTTPTVTLLAAGLVGNAGSPSLTAINAIGGFFWGAPPAAGGGDFL